MIVIVIVIMLITSGDPVRALHRIFCGLCGHQDISHMENCCTMMNMMSMSMMMKSVTLSVYVCVRVDVFLSLRSSWWCCS